MVDGLSPESLDRLVAAAIDARSRAYSPYSRFRVGAALLDDQGGVFLGCNVENVSFSLTLCAERTAAVSAVTAGSRRWRAIAVASDGGVTPCGACRQFLAEFAPDLRIIVVDTRTSELRHFPLAELLPHAFDRTSLERPT